MSKDFPERYRPYNEYLMTTFGSQFNWFEVQKTYNGIGNSPGIYPDVAMLFERFLARDDVQTVVELGSGMSTLYWFLAARKHNKSVFSFEEGPEYLAMVKSLLAHYGVPTDNLNLYEFGAVPKQASLVFHDSQGATRPTFPYLHKELFGSAEFVLVDDSENPMGEGQLITKSLMDLGRYNFYLFNPVGRMDRHVLINPKDNRLRINDWVWSWRPDQVFW